MDRPQRRLYHLNRSVHDAERFAELLALEQDWVVRAAARIERDGPLPASHRAFVGALTDLLRAEEAAGYSENERYLARDATLEQFKVVVAEFAVDGLVESQSHLAIIPRLPARARMAVFRVLVDEFGCGNDEQEHAALYRKLVAELDMPTDVTHYADRADEPSLAYVNLFHWLAARAPVPEYFLGAYAYFESSVLYAYRSYAEATERLRVTNRQYYTEHLYIDTFHSRQMRAALRALAAERPVDFGKAWTGVLLTSTVVAEATDNAIAKARRAA
ncbi:iron-containing redox enzyme family protein [Lentzea sp. NEAU-D13]|uniref:Iron-containing redox enzyme family protein n=1 Tax=Lentzea alba TaxID=2714351 RepID=A0A7C9W312_9PSEU|nr:iron-containing redox enzyme family protein [Lentzea alba]NGY62439.1 iron-containing redox enzyme family protein [Lentzea alba]